MDKGAKSTPEPQYDFTNKEIEEMQKAFESLDMDHDGHVTTEEVVQALDQLGDRMPSYRAKLVVQEVDGDHDGIITWDEFKLLVGNLREARGSGVKKVVRETKNFTQFGGYSSSAEGTAHAVATEEAAGFVDWINHSLGDDEDLLASKTLPITEGHYTLFEACHDGILLAKLINVSVPETIDERALNKKKLNVYNIHENQTLVINSAKAIGVNVINIGAQDLVDGVPHLCLGLIWQIIRIGLLARVNLKSCPGLALLLDPSESIEQFMGLPAEQILLRWFNFHLAKAGCHRRVSNFTSDIADTVCYATLIKQIAPKELGITDSYVNEPNKLKRAEIMLQNADKIKCRRFVKPRDVVNGNPRLNLAFVAHMFNTHPGLDLTEEPELDIEVVGETREEKTFRNWMNSMGVQPYVTCLYIDLGDGLVLLQLFDKVYPGCVDWNRAHYAPFKAMGATIRKIENCTHALELGRKKKFVLVGIDGKDIYDGNRTLTLAVVWQLMRGYTLEVLKRLSSSDKPMGDSDIVAWTNRTLAAAGKKSSISSFKDQSISTSQQILDLVDSIKRNSVDYSLANTATTDVDILMSNAKYAISMARKIGANVYALPEDIVEVNAKMVMTVFACLMACSYTK